MVYNTWCRYSLDGGNTKQSILYIKKEGERTHCVTLALVKVGRHLVPEIRDQHQVTERRDEHVQAVSYILAQAVCTTTVAVAVDVAVAATATATAFAG